MSPFTVNMPHSRLKEGPRIEGTNYRTFTGSVEIDMWHDAKVTVFFDTDTNRFVHPSAEIHVYAGGEDCPLDLSEGIQVNLFYAYSKPANKLVALIEKIVGWVPASWYVYCTSDYNFKIGEWE